MKIEEVKAFAKQQFDTAGETGEIEAGSTESATTTHGRLIDADALLKPIEESWKHAGLHAEDYKKIKKWIKNAPTIVPPVTPTERTGEWERISFPDGDVMECTNCGYRDWGDVWEEESRNFCPNCGAFMHEEELCSREEYAMQIL